MSLVFYYAPMSTAGVTDAVLTELAVPFERVTLTFGPDGTRKPEFLAVNPNGRVPTIVHDGTPIWESSAITLYLGEVFGVDRGLYPAPGPKRGEAMAWVVWAATTLAEAAGRLSALLPRGTPGGVEDGSVDMIPDHARSENALQRAKTDLAKAIGILDAALANKPFILGASYSLADTHLFVFMPWLLGMGIELGEFGNVLSWIQRCGARPAFKRAQAS